MSNITVRMKDGSVRKFPDHGRAGGSYANHVEYVEGFVVVVDVWGKRTALPTADVAEVVEDPGRRF